MRTLTRLRPALAPAAGLALIAAALPAAAQELVVSEPFDGGSNVGAWAWGTGAESIVPLNGNPGAYLQDLTLSSFLPSLRTFGPSVFTGDWRERQVLRIGVDLITLDTDFGVGDRFLTLELTSTNGTPGAGDDFGAFLPTEFPIPDPGVPIDAGWQSYEIEIPFEAEALPPGWTGFGGLEGPGGPSFGDLLGSVDRIAFLSGEPGLVYLLNSWDVGADNPRLAVRDCDQNGVPDFQDLASGALDLDQDALLDACEDLAGDAVSISVSAGGSVGFTLDAGGAHAGELYLLLGSASGTEPGFPLGDDVLPLAVDAYTLSTLGAPNQPPLANSFGTLDGLGGAVASFSLPPGSSPSLGGLDLHHAFVTIDPVSAAATSASDAWPTALQP